MNEKNKTNLGASGMSEEYGELEKVLDTIVEELDARINEGKIKKDAEHRRAPELKEAANIIRKMATKRNNISSDDRDDLDKSKKKTRKLSGVEFLVGIDNHILRLIEEDEMRNENEEKRLQLEERRLSLQENSLGGMPKNVERQQIYCEFLLVILKMLEVKFY